MASSRPRRSTTTEVKYSFALPSSSSSSASDNEAGADGDASNRPRIKPSSPRERRKKGSNNRRKGKARAMSDEDDSGSAFEIDSEAAEEDEDIEDDEAVATDDEGDGSEPNSEAGSIAGSGSDPGSKGHRRILKPILPKAKVTTIRSDVKKDSEIASKRAQVDHTRPRTTMLSPQWMHIGASYEPPYRGLEVGDNGEWVIGTDKAGFDDERQTKWLEAWSLHAFGIHRALIRDAGWEKGKWTEKGLSSKWGGWYELSAKTQPLEPTGLDRYLPRAVWSSKPAKIYLHAKPMTAADEEAQAIPDEAGDGNDADVEAEDEVEADEGIKIWIGPLHDRNEQKLYQIKRFETHRMDEFIDCKPGHVLNAGGPVSGLAWCPRPDFFTSSKIEYLAISCFCSATATLKMTRNPGPSLIQIWSLDLTNPSDVSLRTSGSDKPEMRFEMGLCLEEGDAWELAWCPRGGDCRKWMEDDQDETKTLGILGGVFEDGSVSVYAVPHPVEARKEARRSKDNDTIYLKTKPILKLTLSDTKCTSFAWASHETIVAGCNNGNVAVWSVGEALRSGKQAVRPTHCFSAHFALVRSITVIRVPPLSTQVDGSFDLDGEPTTIVSASYDGSVVTIDLRDLSTIGMMHHERHAAIAVDYCSQTGLLLQDDPEGRIRASILKPNQFGVRTWISSHSGPIWSIKASPYHPFVASAGADGVLLIANTARPHRERLYKGHYGQKVYRIDFNRHLGEYRMIDNILPEARPNADTKQKVLYRGSTTSSSWSPEVGIARAAWHPSLLRAALIASGTMCGLVRIDWCEGGDSVA